MHAVASKEVVWCCKYWASNVACSSPMESLRTYDVFQWLNLGIGHCNGYMENYLSTADIEHIDKFTGEIERERDLFIQYSW